MLSYDFLPSKVVTKISRLSLGQPISSMLYNWYLKDLKIDLKIYDEDKWTFGCYFMTNDEVSGCPAIIIPELEVGHLPGAWAAPASWSAATRVLTGQAGRHATVAQHVRDTDTRNVLQ